MDKKKDLDTVIEKGLRWIKCGADLEREMIKLCKVIKSIIQIDYCGIVFFDSNPLIPTFMVSYPYMENEMAPLDINREMITWIHDFNDLKQGNICDYSDPYSPTVDKTTVKILFGLSAPVQTVLIHPVYLSEKMVASIILLSKTEQRHFNRQEQEILDGAESIAAASIERAIEVESNKGKM